MHNKLLCLLSFAVLATSCKTLNKQGSGMSASDIIVPISGEVMEYRASKTRLNDIIHTKLDVSFDFEKQYLNGKAHITVKPYFYPTKTLVLNAREMEIKEVLHNDKPVNFTYDSLEISIDLDKTYTRNEKYTVTITYVAKPNELTKGGGSEAISDDKGLYFVNPTGKNKNKPTQIWTQGETVSNSVWFPTIDSPNERMTQELNITVDKKYTTLSNGELLYSMENEDNTHTFYWKMDLAHAPYLTMMAVGEFEIVEDEWNDIEVNYYIEKGYKPYAKSIFGNTPEMLTYYSKVLGVDYPWYKYSQILVRDFVSGAMENTTAVLYGDFMLLNDREMLDKDYEYIVAHELFHHWFGDYVTCESWSNIPLNESFATYGEYLWISHKYGKEAADFHSEKSRMGYLNSSKGKPKDLIRFHYNKIEDMFDAHSYNKGGQILHMLRNHVGDDAFFASFKLYLETNKYKSVEIHNLRLAFEEVTGEDLNWFFNQWFLASGHPDISIVSNYDATTQKQKVEITQKQNFKITPLYKIPLAIDIYVNGEVKRHNVVIENITETFEFNVRSKPDLVNVDGDKMLLCTKVENKTIEELVFQYNNAPLYLDRKEAITGLFKDFDSPLAKLTIIAALEDKMWSIRAVVINKLSKKTLATTDLSTVKAIIMKIASADKKAQVRAIAIKYLAGNYIVTEENKELDELYNKALNDKSYGVIGAALEAMIQADSTKGYAIAKEFENSKGKSLLVVLAKLYAGKGGEGHNTYFIQTLPKLFGRTKTQFVTYYGYYLSNINNSATVLKGIDALKLVVEQEQSNKRLVETALEIIEELETVAKKE